MTLQRAVDCSHKEAVDFATMVDREVILYHIAFHTPWPLDKQLRPRKKYLWFRLTDLP